jgi:two-component system, OmpR family, response regulator
MTTILVVDDEPTVRDLLTDAFVMEGYAVVCAGNGAEALDLFRREGATLCVVDVNMPVVNGFEFVQRVREHDTRTPIIMLSARGGDEDVESGLRFGADDYVRKPFSVSELVLRAKNMIRRVEGGDATDRILRAGTLEMNIDTHEVREGERQLDLSATEFRLLEVLLERANRLVTREQLLREVWNIDFDSETSVLDTYVSYLRRKLHHDDYAPVTTVRGVGFKLISSN